MKKYELESLFKSFSLFFFSLGILLTTLFYFDYNQKVEVLKQDLFAQMRLCSFDLKCENFNIDFKKKDGIKPLFLYEEKQGLSTYFEFLGSKQNLLSITYPIERFNKDKQEILTKSSKQFLLLLLIIAILSMLFSIYALYPMKKALFTIEEFIKDILHDVNTPITTIVLNSSLLKKDEKNRDKIEKIQHSTNRILSIQDNLKSYLSKLSTQKEVFDLKTLLIHQKKFTAGIYPHLKWHISDENIKLQTNRDIFVRIISNLISNAAKYNKQDGSISIYIDKKRKTLTISDTGIGIKDTKKIFQRFYKEGERGTGIGLHIVKKLCDELKIEISVTSDIGKGSKFTLNLSKLTIH